MNVLVCETPWFGAPCTPSNGIMSEYELELLDLVEHLLARSTMLDALGLLCCPYVPECDDARSIVVCPRVHEPLCESVCITKNTREGHTARLEVGAHDPTERIVEGEHLVGDDCDGACEVCKDG